MLRKTYITFTLMLFLGLWGIQAAQAQDEYFFTCNSLASATGGAPALNYVQDASCGGGANSFSTATVGACGTQDIAVFPNSGGYEYPAAANMNTYTIHMFFELDNIAPSAAPNGAGYTRLLDWTGSTADQGLYINNTGMLTYYSPGGFGFTANTIGTPSFFSSNTYYFLTVVRDGGGNVSFYVNGTPFGSPYADTGNNYVITAANGLRMFIDNADAVCGTFPTFCSGCETSAGSIAYFSVDGTAASAAQVASTYTNVCSLVAADPVVVTDNTGNDNIEDGGTNSPAVANDTDFGSLPECTGSDTHVFTLQNNSCNPLAFTGLALSNATDFSTTAVDPVFTGTGTLAVGASASFSVTFDPTTAGTLNSTVTISSNAPSPFDAFTFSLTGVGTSCSAPEIDVQGGAPLTSIPDDNGTPAAITTTNGTDFGSVNECGSATSQQTFTIENTGSAALNVSGITASGDFTVGALTPAGPIAASGGTATFTVTFDPTAVGARTGTITIANDDADENPYTFAVGGTGVSCAAPEIDVRGGSPLTSIPDDNGTPAATTTTNGTDFGSVNECGSATSQQTFTIENTGNAALNVTSITGSGDFAVGALTPAGPIAASGGTATFTVTFDPTAAGARTGTITIANDDADENPYTFAVGGTGVACEPEISLSGNGNNIGDGDTGTSATNHTNFGSVSASAGCGATTVVRTFTIENDAAATVNLDITNITLSGTGAGAYTLGGITLPANNIAPNSNTTFTLTFDPAAAGTYDATVTIANNDSDENPFTFAITGVGSVCEPDINVNEAGSNIADGSTGITTEVDFGSANLCTVAPASTTKTYTIENTGLLDLTIAAGAITFTGTHAGDFSVSPTTAMTITPGNSTNITVTFTPGGMGARDATLNIASNDPDAENPYTFNLQGTGVQCQPEINVTGNGTSIADNDGTPDPADHTNFGAQDECANNTITRTFTIENTGSADLNVTAIAMSGVNAADYTVGGITLPATVAHSTSTTFTVTFDPSAQAVQTATVEITNNDADEATYDFAVEGTGTADNTDPNAICVGTETLNVFSGAQSITGADLDGGSTDNCGIASVVITSATGGTLTTGTLTFDAADVAGSPYTATVTVTDVNGRTSTCTSNIEVVENAPTPSSSEIMRGASFIAAYAQDTSRIEVQWLHPWPNEQGYYLYRAEEDGSYAQIAIIPAGNDTIRYMDTGLNPDTQYHYFVRAYRGAETSTHSDQAEDITYPLVPTITDITAACYNSTGSATVTGAHRGGKFRWYDTSSSTENPLKDGAGTPYEESAYYTPYLQNAHTVWVRSLGRRYESWPTEVTIDVKARPQVTLLTPESINSCEASEILAVQDSSGYTYQWFRNGVEIAGATAASYEATQNGRYYVMVYSNGCRTQGTPISLLLNRNVPIFIEQGHATRYCQTGTLSATDYPGASFEWLKDGVSLGTNRTLDVTESGTYQLLATENGCTVTREIQVDVFTFPTSADLTSDANDLCPGEEATLSTVNFNGGTYNWYINGRFFTQTNVPSLTTSTPGTYEVEFFHNEACREIGGTFTLNVNDLPQARIRRDGNDLFLSIENERVPDAITWFLDDVAQPSLTGERISPTQEGVYRAELSFNGCSMSTGGKYYTQVVTGLEDQPSLNGELRIFPNPTNGKLFVQLPEGLSGKVTLALTDQLGRTIHTKVQEAQGTVTLSLEGLPAGAYLLRLSAEGQSPSWHKIIKE